MPKAAQRQFLCKVEGIDGFFARKTGGETSSDVGKVWDGGSLQPESMAGPPVTDDLTFERPYDPEQHSAIVNALRKKVGSERRTITITPTDATLAPVGKATTYPKALLVACNDPDVDAGSGDPGYWMVKFAVDDIA